MKGSQKYYIIAFVILNYFTSIVCEESLNKKLNTFANHLVRDHFLTCDGIKIRKSSSQEFEMTFIDKPHLDINIGRVDSNRIFKYFKGESLEQRPPKYQQQCVVYYISLIGFTQDDINTALESFKLKALQVKASFSYLVISEVGDFKTVENFATSVVLTNFQNRLWIQAEKDNTVSTKDAKEYTSFRYRLWNFCYFCFEGSPGLKQSPVPYSHPKNIQSIHQLFPDNFKDFQGKTMRVVAPPAPPLVIITRGESGNNEIRGQQAIILFSIAKHLNFTFSLHPSPGGLTGIRLANGTWNGIMGEILYDRADIGLCVATSSERYQIVDVTVAVFYAFLVLVSTKPKPVFEWQAIFYPFKANCWLGFIVATVFTFYVSKWLHNNAIRIDMFKIKDASKTNDNALVILKRNLMTNYKSFYVTVGQLLEQGTPFDITPTPSRTYILFWMFFAIIITTAYRSKLFMFLTFPQVEIPPGTFAELARSTYKWGMKHLGGIAFVFITKSPLPYIRQIGEKMSIYNDKYSCLDRTFTDRFTCIIYKAYIEYLMEVRYWQVRHNFYISDSVTPPVGSSWVFPKHAAWLPAFDKVSYPIYEMGLADKYLYDYQIASAKILREKAKASNSTDDLFELNTNTRDDGGPKPLVMDNLYAAFFILLFGLAVSSVCLALEVGKRNKIKLKTVKARKQLLKARHLKKPKKSKQKLATNAVKTLSNETVQIIVSTANLTAPNKSTSPPPV